MTIREGILQRLALDLPNMASINGYDLEYAKIVSGYISGADCKTFPTVYYHLGLETIKRSGEGNNIQLCDLTLAIGCHIKASKEQGNLTTISEQVVGDLKKFIHQDICIAGAGTANHKVLKLNKVLSQGKYGASGVQKWDIQSVYTLLDTANSKGEVIIQITISYFDYHNSVNDFITI